MEIFMKQRKLFSAFAAVIMLLALCTTAFADNSYRIDLTEYGYNFSAIIPESCKLETALDNEEMLNNGILFEAARSEDKATPFYSYRVGTISASPTMANVYNTNEEQFNAICGEIGEVSTNMYGLEIVQMCFDQMPINGNGNDFLRCFYTLKNDKSTVFVEDYFIPIDGELIYFGVMYYTADGDEAYADKAAELAQSFIGTVEITGKVGDGTTSGTTAAASTQAKQSALDKISGFEFPMWIFLAALAVLLIAGATVAKRGEWQPEPLSLNNSKCIQGFCAVAIILHHMSQNVTSNGGDAGALSILVDAGVLFVGIFFFFSGFGLLKSLRTKESYLKGFIRKRLPMVLVPFFACILVFIFTALFLGERFRFPDILGYLSGWLLINSHMWYIVEIVILYLAFFIIFKLIKNEKIAIPVMGGFIVLMVIGSLLLGHGEFWFQGEWWFNSTFLFFIGIVVARFEEPLARLAKKLYVILLPVLIVGFGFMFALNLKMLGEYSYWSDTTSSFICFSVQLPTIIMFVAIVLLVMMKVNFSNRVLKFIGSIALELYLIHNLFIQYLRSSSFMYVKSDSMYILLVILLAVALAWVIHGFDKYATGLFTGKTHPSVSVEGDKKIHSIDFLRLVAMFFVVAIHIPFDNKYAAGLTIAFGKIAVPFFLVVCGYFLYNSDSAVFMKRLKKQALRIFLLTVAANIFYLVFELFRALNSGTMLSDFFSESFTAGNILNFFLWNMSPFSGHLWYLGSLLYAILIIMLLNKLKVYKWAMFAAPVLLAGYIALSFMLNPENYFMYRNAVLCTLPYLMIGCIINRYKDKLMKPSVWWYIGSGVVLCVLVTIENRLHRGDVSMPYFSSELLVYALMLTALKLPSLFSGTLAEKLGGKNTLFMYIVHISVAELIMSIQDVPAFFRTLAPFVVFIATLLISALWNFLKSFIKKRPKVLPENSEVIAETQKTTV